MSREQQQERPLTVMEIAGHLIRPLTPATPLAGKQEFSFYVFSGAVSQERSNLSTHYSVCMYVGMYVGL